MFKELKNLRIFGEFQGEKVEITKLDFINKTCNIIKTIFGKKVKFAYNTNNEFGKSLVINNFTNIEIIEE